MSDFVFTLVLAAYSFFLGCIFTDWLRSKREKQRMPTEIEQVGAFVCEAAKRVSMRKIWIGVPENGACVDIEEWGTITLSGHDAVKVTLRATINDTSTVI